MSYLVLARKYRPQSFTDLIGQSHIAELLTKAITAQKLSQAYLFTGPRGVGKTSCARILAKSLNCEHGISPQPCNECHACVEITKGSSFDVLEIDGASNRGIDEIRSLRENVKFAPGYGRYKVYIIDEVHMLTNEAFNALLKTLEEPPEHVKFILATTEPNKIPATIISRCQRYDFKRINIETIMELIAEIAHKEQLNVDEEAAYFIAKAAEGSLRDALSIFDQVSAVSDTKIHANDVSQMLALVETQSLFELATALTTGDCATAFEQINQLIEKGKDLKQLVQDLIEHYRNILVIKVGGKQLGKLIHYPVHIKEQLLAQSDHFSIEQILSAIDEFVMAQELMRSSSSQRIPLEIAFVKIAHQSTGTALPQQQVQQPQQPRPAPQPVKKKHVEQPQPLKQEAPTVTTPVTEQPSPSIVEEKVKESIPEPEPIATQPKPSAATTKTQSIDNDVSHFMNEWDNFTQFISQTRISLATYLQEAHPVRADEEYVYISFHEKNEFFKETVEQQDNQKIIEDLFAQFFKLKPTPIKFILGEKVPNKPEEDHVDDVLNTFDGKVVSRWHNDSV